MAFKILTKSSLILVVILSLLTPGCTNNNNENDGMVPNDNTVTGKIYFTSNMFPGETFEETRGVCVYEHGRVKKLYRYQFFPAVTKDGSMLISSRVYRNIINKAVKICDNSVSKQVELKHIPGQFRWFSDNEKFIYVGHENPEPYVSTASNIYLVDLKTMKETQLTNYKNNNDRISYIELSPDEKYILYDYDVPDDNLTGYLKILDIETGKEKVLPFSAIYFTWNSYANKIILQGIYKFKNDVIFRSKDAEWGPRLIIYDPETEKMTRFPINKSYASIRYLTSSPDGKKIAYVRNENSGQLTLWVMDPDCTNHQMLYASPYTMDYLSWSEK